MNNEQQTTIQKVEGEQRYEVFATVKNGFGEYNNKKIGEIFYSWARKEYRYKERWTVFYPEGRGENQLRIVSDKLHELNKELYAGDKKR